MGNILPQNWKENHGKWTWWARVATSWGWEGKSEIVYCFLRFLKCTLKYTSPRIQVLETRYLYFLTDKKTIGWNNLQLKLSHFDHFASPAANPSKSHHGQFCTWFIIEIYFEPRLVDKANVAAWFNATKIIDNFPHHPFLTFFRAYGSRGVVHMCIWNLSGCMDENCWTISWLLSSWRCWSRCCRLGVFDSCGDAQRKHRPNDNDRRSLFQQVKNSWNSSSKFKNWC